MMLEMVTEIDEPVHQPKTSDAGNHHGKNEHVNIYLICRADAL